MSLFTWVLVIVGLVAFGCIACAFIASTIEHNRDDEDLYAQVFVSTILLLIVFSLIVAKLCEVAHL